MVQSTALATSLLSSKQGLGEATGIGVERYTDQCEAACLFEMLQPTIWALPALHIWTPSMPRVATHEAEPSPRR